MTIKHPSKFNNLNRLWSYLIINQMTKYGVKSFFSSPGMRNAPLLWAIQKHPLAQVNSARDERSHSFSALGSAKSSGLPSALICTSGSALANYLPAIIEASKTGTPLIIISADRPHYLIEDNANQTIKQKGIFSHYAKKEIFLTCPDENIRPKEIIEMIDQSIPDLLNRPHGILHINIEFDGALTNEEGEISKDYLSHSFNMIHQKKDDNQEILPAVDISKEISNPLALYLRSKRPFLIIGEIPVYEDKESLKELLKHIKHPYTLDITSGLKFFKNQVDGQIPSMDHPEVYQIMSEYRPDIIFHIGGRTTSKHYERFLKERNEEVPVFHYDHSPYPVNPGHAVTQSFNLSPKTFASILLNHISSQSMKECTLNWVDLIQKKSQYINQAPLCYPSITKAAIEELNDSIDLFIGNSTFIRSFDSYATCSVNKNFNIYSNRGASGIEGHLSTAIGIVKSSKKPLVLFLGDITLFHDLNSLIVLRELNLPILVILADNKKGGIFNLLPFSQDKENKDLLDIMTTPLELNWRELCSSMALSFDEVKDQDSYKSALNQWQRSPKTKVLSCHFKDKDNQKLYQQLRTIKL